MILSKTHIKKTQKRRRCDWCGEHIEQGDPSVVINAVWDDDFQSVRFHPECHYGWDNTNSELYDEWELHAQERGKPLDKGTE